MNTCPTALIVDKDTHSGTLSARNFVSMFRSLSYLFPVLVFAVAAMIVVNTLTRMIENQRVQMGTLKALGYRDRQIRLHYLSYAIVPSVAGSLLGVLTGQSAFRTFFGRLSRRTCAIRRAFTPRFPASLG